MASGDGTRPKPSPQDRRRHPRFPVDECTVVLQRSGIIATIGLRKENIARDLLDLSEGGMRVRTAERLEIGAKVRIRLVLTRYSDEIEAWGEVRWTATPPLHPSEHTAGIKFTKIDPRHARKIANMKNWFLSPQFRHKSAQKGKNRPREIIE